MDRCSRFRPGGIRRAGFSRAAARAPRAAKRPQRRRAWLRIFVVRCGLPCDPPVGGHSCNRGMIPRFHRGSPEATRRAFNKRFLLDLAEDWQQHGREVFKRVRRESPAAYLKVCAMLVPKEMKIEHQGGVKAMTDEEIERAIEVIQDLIVQRDAAANAKVIE